jgi:hypothetical protein
MARRPKAARKNNGAKLGSEEMLWQADDKLRSEADAAGQNGVPVDLRPLNHAIDVPQEHCGKPRREPQTDPEDRDERTFLQPNA